MNFTIEEPTAISFGKFDGLHKGHKFLMQLLYEEQKRGLKTVAFSFQTPPNTIVKNAHDRLLTTEEEKIHVFSQTHIDYLIEYPFTETVMRMPAEDFLDKIVNDLHVKSIIVGNDFRFGFQRQGDIYLLDRLSQRYGYQLHVVDKVLFDNQEISSTLIRTLLIQNKLKTVEELLGYPYFVMGTIEKGKQIGRTIGFPTLNIYPLQDKLLPPDGGYASRITIKGKRYYGITNIGTNPTVSNDATRVIETHVFEFHEDVYGENVKIELLEFVREEKKYDSLDDLKKQIHQDVEQVKKRYLTQSEKSPTSKR
ncbi:bifunctional riboflavin kinase/FAD synthetase [Eubacterium oxidoreducens]|nr:bifunctional riboflavin kinase/FAD synthetase [Eubacterium oxidoreducens]